MSGLLALVKPRPIKASHRRRGKVASGPIVQRYYDPQIGRFLSVDPVTADAAGGGNFNRYWYANNNPYKFVDPDGRFGIAGFVIGAGIEAGFQLARDGKITSWKSVAISGAVGVVTGGVAGVLGKAAVATTITTRTAIAGTAAASGVASAVGKAADGGSGKEIAIAGGVGLLAGGAGAKAANSVTANLEQHVAKSNIWGTIGRTTQAATTEGGKVAERATTLTQKAAQVTTDVVAAKVEREVNK